MRVAIDVSIPSRTSTGVGVYAMDLLDSLRRRPLDVQVWRCPLGPPGGRLTRLLNGGRLVAWHEWQVRRRAARERIDVYHSACAVGPMAVGRPVVMTVHDASLLAGPNQYGTADRLYHQVFSVLAARRAAAVIVPSLASRDDLARRYRVSTDRLHVVPYGVAPLFGPTTSAEQAAVRARYGLDQPYVLCVGAEPPRKNLPRTVAAFGQAAALTGDRHTQLVLVGPPEPRDVGVDQAVARLGLAARVRRLGGVPRADLPALYGAATCLCYVSLCEGFGFPIVEAMACRTAVLTSLGSSTAQVAGKAAVLVEPTSTAAIGDALAGLMSDVDHRREVAARGPARAREFSWERTALLTETVYRSVAGGH